MTPDGSWKFVADPEYRLIAGSPAINGRVVEPGETVVGYASGQAYLVVNDGSGVIDVKPISNDIARAYEDDAKRAETAKSVAKVMGW